ncbi:MAG: ribulose-phosphate 3-epimerase [Chitinophagales bacterium]|nr:ribulose-phosphate 3-epimerase [Chitinophagales bacterium]
MNNVIIAPSVLSANFANLQADIEMLNHSDAEWIHIDVMDGVFVPNISFGFPVLQSIRKHTNKFLDVHLMIQNPDQYVHQFRDAGANQLTVHYEGNIHLDSLINKIKAAGMHVGVALNPATSVSVLSPIIHLLDMVLIMSVNPGFGGQKFIPYAVHKIELTKELIESKHAHAKIQVDGGVTLDNAKELIHVGASILVAGSAVFNSPDPKATITALKNAHNI